MNLKAFFNQEKQRALADCTVCGLCAKICPIVPKTGMADKKPQEIQQAAHDFIAHGTDSAVLRERIDSCMKCYGCVDVCPHCETCKIALTGLDIEGSRPILKAIGAEIVEMPRTGKKAACCGCAAIGNYPSTGNRMLTDRIDEASKTGAGILATVCHFCNQMLASKQGDVSFVAESYINLTAPVFDVEQPQRIR